MTTVSGVNIKEIPDIIDTVVAAGADVFAFARYCPTSGEKDTGIAPQEYRELLDTCYKKYQKYEAEGCSTYFNKKDHLWTLYEHEQGIFKIPEDAREGMIYSGCNCGNCHMTILPNGDIYACRRVQNSKVGNAFLDRLADIWVCQMEQYRDITENLKNAPDANCWHIAAAAPRLPAAGTGTSMRRTRSAGKRCDDGRIGTDEIPAFHSQI